MLLDLAKASFLHCSSVKLGNHSISFTELLQGINYISHVNSVQFLAKTTQ